MPVIAHKQNWKTHTEGRGCGTCHACCIWLGVEELRKPAGVPCKWLSKKYLTHRCSVYELSTKPEACTRYSCLWLSGYGPEVLQPVRSGLIITPYMSQEDDTPAAFTVHVFDKAKAKQLPLLVAQELLQFVPGCEVRVVFVATKQLLWFHEGIVEEGTVTASADPEALDFVVHRDRPPAGHYLLKELPE